MNIIYNLLEKKIFQENCGVDFLVKKGIFSKTESEQLNDLVNKINFKLDIFNKLITVLNFSARRLNLTIFLFNLKIEKVSKFLCFDITNAFFNKLLRCSYSNGYNIFFHSISL